MILVTTGTNGSPFDRLLRAVASLEIDEELIVQYGPSTIRTAGGTNIAYLPFAELEALVRRARIVVTHAGVGSVLLALLNGTRPVVVPRLPADGEAVDDHQVALAKRLADLGLVELVDDVSALAATMVGMEPSLGERTLAGAGALAQDVRCYLDSVCGEHLVAGAARAAEQPLR